MRSAYSTNLVEAVRRSRTPFVTHCPVLVRFTSVAGFFLVMALSLLYFTWSRAYTTQELASPINACLESQLKIGVTTATFDVLSDCSADHIGYGALFDIGYGF